MADTLSNPWLNNGPGNCYQVAVHLCETLSQGLPDELSVEIVHGLVTGTGGEAEGIRYGHAWVEVNRSVCFDASRGGEPACVPRPLYYEAGSVDPVQTYRYTLAQAHRAMVDSGHYGPWHASAAQAA